MSDITVSGYALDAARRIKAEEKPPEEIIQEAINGSTADLMANIESLQRAIAKRDQKIEWLEKQVVELREGTNP